jgi:predicted GH43/DUF377 family glycosyl hydrolase
MSIVERFIENPFLLPGIADSWDSAAAFNPCVTKDNSLYHLVYRAQSRETEVCGKHLSISTIGYANSIDGKHFNHRKLLIEPEYYWEKFGCEDPRITELNGKYYIFYTALSSYPFEWRGIRLGVAITTDFNSIQEKHPVTPFNSKAMALFPETIDGQIAAILTVHSDLPPAKIAIAQFSEEQDIWSEEYWEDWYSCVDDHIVSLLRSSQDHLEVGAPPLKTERGWLLIFCYIENYFSDQPKFAIEAALLDLDDPRKVIGRMDGPLLVPEKEYELRGDVKNVIFPSGALINGDYLYIYYGATDTTCCGAYCLLNDVLERLNHTTKKEFVRSDCLKQGFKRYQGNPIISPRIEITWEAKATFNPAAIYYDGLVHLIYRAMSFDNTSVFGYANSENGFDIKERLSMPIYEPRESFEQKLRPGNSGCEDPRLTLIGDHIYMFYTAFDGYTPRVAFSSILVDDFIQKRWRWTKAMAVTPPGIDDKDACLLGKKINNQYVIFHRVGNNIRIDSVDQLVFAEGQWLRAEQGIIKPRKTYWDNRKFGIAAPPIEIDQGWLLFFHRISIPGDIYKIEAMLLESSEPMQIIAETDATILEPEQDYECFGHVNNVVFPCGAILKDDKIFLYYGAGDKVTGVARMALAKILKRLGL